MFMKIAIPTAEGQLCAHFGHCQQFAVIEVDIEKKAILNKEMITPPPHEPGVLPQWLNQMGCNTIIAGGMGQRAIGMFSQFGINVVTGATPGNPEDIVTDFLHKKLVTADNICDMSEHHHGGEGCRSHEENSQ